MTAKATANQLSDPAGFDRFYRTHFQAVYSRLVRRGAKPQDAEDITQEAMLRTYEKRDTFPDERVARTSVLTTAERLLIDNYRHLNVAALPVAEFHDVASDTTTCPQRLAELSDTRRLLRSAMSRLSQRDRDLLVDTAVHGLRGAELAERYHATSGALRVRRLRSREVLRPQLEQLRHAPAALPLLAVRKVVEGMRSAARWLSGLVPCTGGQVLGLVVAVLSVSVDTSSSLSASAMQAARLSPTYAASIALDAAPSWADVETGVRPGAAPSSSTWSRPTAYGTAGTSRRAPALCVDSRCPLGGSPDDPGDVLTVHLPQPVGDRQVKQGTVPVCRMIPDSPVADCQTQGTPKYRVPPPRDRT